MDPQISYIRMLVGDNTVPYTYSDVQIRAAISITSTPPTGPHDLVMCALIGYLKFPVP